jgi:hypothetical protein
LAALLPAIPAQRAGVWLMGVFSADKRSLQPTGSVHHAAASSQQQQQQQFTSPAHPKT